MCAQPKLEVGTTNSWKPSADRYEDLVLLSDWSPCPMAYLTAKLANNKIGSVRLDTNDNSSLVGTYPAEMPYVSQPTKSSWAWWYLGTTTVCLWGGMFGDIKDAELFEFESPAVPRKAQFTVRRKFCCLDYDTQLSVHATLYYWKGQSTLNNRIMSARNQSSHSWPSTL